MTSKRIVGVLGGMGPLATVDLYRKIIEATPAARDQDHLHVIIDADPRIPDRTEALLHGGADPTPLLIAAARRLAAAGVDFIVMPCNTAHAFLPRLRDEIPVPFVSMIEQAAHAAAAVVPPGSTVGILATEGTIAAGLYQDALHAANLHPIVPDAANQTHVTAAIAAVKAGRVGKDVTSEVLLAASHLVERGARALLAACTELPIVLGPEDVPVPLIDPTAVLAQAAVRAATDAAGPRPEPQPEAATHAISA